MQPYIDLRSDTVSRPTQAMRQAMAAAVVGDDVYGEDPTVSQLESRVATLFGKEAALFFPTGTMSNLAALLAWCPERGSEVIVGKQSHIFLYEQAGACHLGSLSLRTVDQRPDGTMDRKDIEAAIRPENDVHEPRTRLVCVENTHNGSVLPPAYLHALQEDVLRPYGLPVHLDGARIWNALAASGQRPAEAAAPVDSLSVCLSKGLGCPAGSLLVGPYTLVAKARRIRKALGGGMRQTGVLAAAGLVALDDFEAGILGLDHARAQRLAHSIQAIPGFRLYTPVDTNILFVCSDEDDAAKRLREKGVLATQWEPRLLRLVVHRDLQDADIDHVIQAFQQLSPKPERKKRFLERLWEPSL